LQSSHPNSCGRGAALAPHWHLTFKTMTLLDCCCSAREKGSLDTAATVKKKKSEAEERAGKEKAQLVVLEEKIAKTQVQHRTFMSQLEQNLSDLDGKLEKAENNLSPWADITDAKQHLGEMQRAVDQEMNHTEQQLLSNPQASDASADSPKVNALQEELLQRKLQRRSSLSALSETLSELGTKIETAEGSWAPWNGIKDAKKQLEETQCTVTQQQEDNVAGATKNTNLSASDVPPVLV